MSLLNTPLGARAASIVGALVFGMLMLGAALPLPPLA